MVNWLFRYGGCKDGRSSENDPRGNPEENSVPVFDL